VRSGFGAERQEIRYCRTADSVRLAYAISGQGPPLVKTGNFLNHLEYDWESPIWRYLFVGLSRDHRLIRYDPRGTGLSDWDVDEISLDARVNDLATVVDAAGVERFPLLGASQGCAVSIAYAVKYPEGCRIGKRSPAAAPVTAAIRMSSVKMRAMVCEIASKRGPAEDGAHIIEYMEKSNSFLGSSFARM
jgi:pimeloyl-ACP methyl ester carboxylesterase